MADFGSAGFILSVVSIPFFIIIHNRISWNVLLIRIVQKTPEMHSVTNYLLANLAVSDGLTIFFLCPSVLLERNDFLKKFDCRLKHGVDGFYHPRFLLRLNGSCN